MKRFCSVLLFLLALAANAATERLGDNYALVVIDMQAFFSENGVSSHEANPRLLEEMLQEQLRLIALARGRNLPVIFVEYAGCGETVDRLRQAVEGYAHTTTVVKTTDGMFVSGTQHADELGDYLRERRIGRLIIAGANGNYCVKDSIEGALENGYVVLADARAIADFNDRPRFSYPFSYGNRYTGTYARHFREVEYSALAQLLSGRNTRHSSRHP